MFYLLKAGRSLTQITGKQRMGLCLEHKLQWVCREYADNNSARCTVLETWETFVMKQPTDKRKCPEGGDCDMCTDSCQLAKRPTKQEGASRQTRVNVKRSR